MRRLNPPDKDLEKNTHDLGGLCQDLPDMTRRNANTSKKFRIGTPRVRRQGGARI